MIGEGVLAFNVTDLNVTVEEGIKIKWQGKEIDSGRLCINLGRPGSRAVINYETGQVNVEFRAEISFEEIAAIE